MDSRLRGNERLASGHTSVGESKLKFYSHCMTFGHRQSSCQLVEQRFGVNQIFRIEAFGEPIVDRL